MERKLFSSLIISIVLLSLLSSVSFSADSSFSNFGSPADAQIGAGVTGIFHWIVNSIELMFGIPEDKGLFSGYLLSYIIFPVLLVFLMFYGILLKVNIFDRNISKWMSVVLALGIVPLGAYNLVFAQTMAYMSYTTAFLLYIFLFIAMFGYGYKKMFAKGLGDYHAGKIYIDQHKQLSNIESMHTKTVQALSQQISEVERQKSEFIMTQDPNDPNYGPSLHQFNIRLDKLRAQLTVNEEAAKAAGAHKRTPINRLINQNP